MSQIHFSAELNDGAVVDVMTGYDRPLSYCHLTVSRADDGELIYSELDERNPFHNRPPHVIDALDRLGVPYPVDLSERLYDHVARWAGNEDYTYEGVITHSGSVSYAND